MEVNKPQTLPLSLVGSKGSGQMVKQTIVVSEISAMRRESQNAMVTHERWAGVGKLPKGNDG